MFISYKFATARAAFWLKKANQLSGGPVRAKWLAKWSRYMALAKRIRNNDRYFGLVTLNLGD